MVLLSALDSPTPLARVDPRARIVAGFVLAAAIAALRQWPSAAIAAGGALIFCVAARLPWAPLLRRLALAGLMVLCLAPSVWLDWSTLPPRPAAAGGEGLRFMALTLGKAGAIVMILTACFSTIPVTTLGQALGALRFPAKLVHLLVFTVRYAEVLHREAQRLRRAARVRGFRWRCTRHTYRTLAAWIGLLLIRGLDRSEQVLAAMRCRGYDGQFRRLPAAAPNRRDALFLSGAAVALLILAGLEWT